MMSSVLLLSHVRCKAHHPLSPRVLRTTLYDIAESLQHAYPHLDDRELAALMAGLFDWGLATDCDEGGGSTHPKPILRHGRR